MIKKENKMLRLSQYKTIQYSIVQDPEVKDLMLNIVTMKS